MVGTIASLVLTFVAQQQPLVAWLAVGVALVAGFLATWAAVVEFAEWRAQAQADAAAERAEQRDRVRALHASQRDVLASVEARSRALRTTLGETRSELQHVTGSLDKVTRSLGQSQLEVSRLRGDIEGLRIENAGLRAELEALAAVQREGAADVLALPRRGTTGQAGTEWDALEAPTVVDLDLQRLVSPLVADLRSRQAI